jgi:hypothetical protein
MKKITFAFIFLMNAFLIGAQNTWTQKANFSATRQDAYGLSIGTKGYMGGGFYSNDFWQYDPSTNAWTQKANVGGGSIRTSAAAFSIGTKGYVGTGFDGFGAYFDDFWEYDPTANTWTQKANFAGGARSWAAGFSIGTKGYIGTGYSGGGVGKVDFWEYDPSTNIWTQKANVGGVPRFMPVAFSIGTKGYIGTGRYSGSPALNDFWEYDPSSNTWTQKANFGGGVRDLATGFSIGTKGYIGTGYDHTTFFNDFWEYDPSVNTWTQKANFGGGIRYEAASFSIGTKGYIGTGLNGSGVTQTDFWEYTPSAQPATLTTNSINGLTFCPSGTVSVPYTAAGTYTAGNIFTAQLSNASGSFASPTNIGTLTSTASGTINATLPGSPAGTGYRIRVVSSTPVVTSTDNGSNLTVVGSPCYTWGGTSSTVWSTAGNWVPAAAPSSTDNVVIPAGAPNYPYLTANLSHSATIVIDPNANLKIDGLLTNNGTITVNSGGSLVQTSGSTLAGSGTFNVKRSIANLTSFISSPINNESVFSFGITPTGPPGGQIIPNGCNPNNVSTSSPYGNLLELQENPTVLSNCAQSLWFVKSTGNMTNGRGYSLRNGPVTLSYTGTVNNGTITYSGLTRQGGTIADGDGSTPTRGWHLVGNPYPSPITLNSGDLGAGFDNQIAIYNNGVWISHTLSVSPVTVAVGQGFQIRNSTAGTSPNFSLTNSLRTAANPTFYKQGLLIDHYVTIYLNNGTQSDKTMVYFIDGASDNFDPVFDANRMSDDIDLPMVYTIASGERLSYNALPTMIAGESKSVPMGIRTEVPGNHTISFNDLPTLEATTVMLEDLKLDTIQQLSEGYVYNFTTVAGDPRDRFVLHFAADAPSGIWAADKSPIPVYSFGDHVYINMKNLAAEEQVTATAFDFTGRVLFREELKGGSLFTKAMEAIGTNLVIVQLTNNKGETFKRKLFISEKN